MQHDLLMERNIKATGVFQFQQWGRVCIPQRAFKMKSVPGNSSDKTQQWEGTSSYSSSFLHQADRKNKHTLAKMHYERRVILIQEAVLPSSQSAGLVIWRPRVQVPPGDPQFKSLAMLVNSQLVRLLPVGILLNHMLCFI